MLRGEQCAKCLQTVSTLNIQFYPQEGRGFNISFIDNPSPSYTFKHYFHLLSHLCLRHELKHYFHCFPNIWTRLVKDLYNPFIRVSRVLIQHLLCYLIILVSILDKSENYFQIIFYLQNLILKIYLSMMKSIANIAPQSLSLCISFIRNAIVQYLTSVFSEPPSWSIVELKLSQ